MKAVSNRCLKVGNVLIGRLVSMVKILGKQTSVCKLYGARSFVDSSDLSSLALI
jgi:hypothetical protein